MEFGHRKRLWLLVISAHQRRRLCAPRRHPRHDARAARYHPESGTISNYFEEIQAAKLEFSNNATIMTCALKPKEVISLIQMLCIVELIRLIKPFR